MFVNLVIDPADNVGHVRVHRRHPLLSATDAPGHDSRLKYSTSSGIEIKIRSFLRLRLEVANKLHFLAKEEMEP